MSSKEHLLQKAVAFYQNGDCETARRLLLSILADDPDYQPAWIWYANTFQNLADRQRILGDVLNRNPRLRDVGRAYRLLQQSRRRLFGEPDVIPITSGAERAMSRPIWPVINGRGGGGRRPPTDDRRAEAERGPVSWMVLAALLIFALMASTLFFDLRAGMLRQENIRLKIDNGVLQLKIGQLEKDLEKLTLRFDLLTAEGAAFSKEYGSLVQEYDALKAEHLQLKRDYEALGQNVSVQDARYRELQARYQNLEARYTALYNFLLAMRVPVFYPTVPVQQPGMYVSFRKLDGTLLQWVVPNTTLQSEIKRADDARKANKTITLNSKDGQHLYTFHDAREYINSGAFKEVVPELYRQSPNEDVFIREVWNITRQLNFKKTDPRQDTPHAPLESIQARGGDSEDAAIFFASMIKAAPVNWQVKLLYLNAETPTIAINPNHIAVQVDTGRATYIVDPTSKDNMTPYPANLDGWYFGL